MALLVAVTTTEQDIIRWFAGLSEPVRYRFSTCWLNEQVGNLSNPALAELLPGEKKGSESFIKAFRSYDLKKEALKRISRPKDGFTAGDVHLICEAINQYRSKTNNPDRVNSSQFYQSAWQALSERYPLVSEDKAVKTAENGKTNDLLAPSVRHAIGQVLTRPMVFAVVMVLLLLLIFGFGALQLFRQNASNIQAQTIAPGALVQWQLLSSDEQRSELSPPEFYLSAKRCFPKLEAKTQSMTSLSIAQVERWGQKPHDKLTLLLTDALVKRWRAEQLRFIEPNRQYLSKGMLNLGVSPECLASLQQVVDAGGTVEQFAMVKQVFAAQKIVVDLSITEDSDAVVDDLTRQYPAIMNTTSKQLTILGPIVLGYFSQPMSAIMSE